MFVLGKSGLTPFPLSLWVLVCRVEALASQLETFQARRTTAHARRCHSREATAVFILRMSIEKFAVEPVFKLAHNDIRPAKYF